ncbi:MAG: SAM-dependent methyltransferase [Myxococcota bacterium]|jgi:SAM-dependent methyltransferase
MSYVNQAWMRSVERTTTPLYRRVIYDLVRPMLSARARTFLSPEFLAEVAPDMALFGRGFPLEHRRRWATQGLNLSGTTILVQGTGTGWDVVGWASLKPKKIIATDLFPFDDSWPEIAAYCRDTHGVEVEFRQAPLEAHAFLDDASVDLCVSDAVFEHCRDLPAVMAETMRVLRPGGLVYASYGPLWYAPGGDHFSGRSTLDDYYNHVLLEPAAYQRFFATHREPVEDFQSGGRYVELDLFSKLTTRDYLKIFRDAGFTRESLRLELSWYAVQFRERHGDKMGPLLARNSGKADKDDLLVTANFIRLRRP